MSKPNPFKGTAAFVEVAFGGLDFHKPVYRRRFSSCIFSGNLNAAAFHGCSFDRCVFEAVSLAAASFTDCTFTRSDFRAIDLTETSFFAATATGCSFDRSRFGPKTLIGFTVNHASINQVHGLLRTEAALNACYAEHEQGWHVYRTFGIWTPKPAGWLWEPGELLSENCNLDRFARTGSGVHFTTAQMLRHEPRIWECLLPRWADICMPYFHESGRASLLRLIGEINNPFHQSNQELF